VEKRIKTGLARNSGKRPPRVCRFLIWPKEGGLEKGLKKKQGGPHRKRRRGRLLKKKLNSTRDRAIS